MNSFVFDPNDKLVEGNFPALETSRKLRNRSFWVPVRRYTGALFIYLVYWFTIWGVLKQVVGATLSPGEAEELVESGIINSVWEYGWGNHYVWFFIVLCLTTYCSAILSGATAKKNGAIVASIANLPVIIFMSFMCYFIYLGNLDLDVETPIAWKIVFALSILGSIFFSVRGGSAGQQWQNNMFSSNTILGIRPIHWWWLIFPLHFAVLELVPKIAATLRALFISTLIKETKYSVMLFLLFVIFATFIYFVIWGWFKAFQLLSLKHKKNIGRFRITLSVLFYLWGIPLLFDGFCILIYILIIR